MRRADGARAQDHVAPDTRFMHLTIALIGNADRLHSIEDDPRGLSLCHDLEIGAALVQIRRRRRFTKTLARGDLVEPDAFDSRAIKIGIESETRFLTGLDEQ